MRDGEGILQQAPLEYCVLQLAHPKNKKMLIYVTRNARLGVVRNTIPPAFSQLSLEDSEGGCHATGPPVNVTRVRGAPHQCFSRLGGKLPSIYADNCAQFFRWRHWHRPTATSWWQRKHK